MQKGANFCRLVASFLHGLLLKHSSFVSHFIAEEGYSILTETFSHKSFLVSDNRKILFLKFKDLAKFVSFAEIFFYYFSSITLELFALENLPCASQAEPCRCILRTNYI